MKYFVLLLSIAWSATSLVDSHGVVQVEDFTGPGQSIIGEEALAKYLGLPDDFSLRKEQTRNSVHGLQRVRLGVYYKGLPVRQCTLVASSTAQGVYNGAISGTIPDLTDFIAPDLSGHLTECDLKEITVDFVNRVAINPRGETTTDDLRKFSFTEQIVFDIHGDPIKAYYVKSLVDKYAFFRSPRVLIDTSGHVIDGTTAMRFGSGRRCPMIQGGNPVLNITFGPDSAAGQVCLNVKRVGNTCFLENDKVRVISSNNDWSRDNTDAISFPCDSSPGDAINGANSPASDAFYYAQVYEDMMNDIGDVEKTTEAGTPHIMYVHFGKSYGNAFWDGYFSTFGNGDDKNYPLTGPDIVAHEMCHAYTESLGNMQFTDQSAVIDEVFSDVCGNTILFYLGRPIDWRFGGLTRKDPNNPFRWFDVPSKNPFFVDHMKDVSVGELFQAMGPFEKFYYSLIAEKGYSYQSAFELFVHANTLYWKADTSFKGATCGLLMSASDIGMDVSTVGEAMDAVGLDHSSCNLAGTHDLITEKDRRRKNIRVSSRKNPVFTVEIPDGKDGAKITAQGNCDDVFFASGSTEGTNEIVISGSGVLSFQVSSKTAEEISVNIIVKFM